MIASFPALFGSTLKDLFSTSQFYIGLTVIPLLLVCWFFFLLLLLFLFSSFYACHFPLSSLSSPILGSTFLFIHSFCLRLFSLITVVINHTLYARNFFFRGIFQQLSSHYEMILCKREKYLFSSFFMNYLVFSLNLEGEIDVY